MDAGVVVVVGVVEAPVEVEVKVEVEVEVDEPDGESSPTVVAARCETSKDQLSLFAPDPTADDEFGLRSNQHGVSEPDQSSLTVAVLLPPPTPWCCFSAQCPALASASLCLAHTVGPGEKG